jgi:hypothetical protein
VARGGPRRGFGGGPVHHAGLNQRERLAGPSVPSFATPNSWFDFTPRFSQRAERRPRTRRSRPALKTTNRAAVLLIETDSISGFSRTFDDPASRTSRSLCVSSEFSVVSQRRRKNFIKSAGEPISVIGPNPSELQRLDQLVGLACGDNQAAMPVKPTELTAIALANEVARRRVAGIDQGPKRHQAVEDDGDLSWLDDPDPAEKLISPSSKPKPAIDYPPSRMDDACTSCESARKVLATPGAPFKDWARQHLFNCKWAAGKL